MMKLELILLLFPIEYLKHILIPESKKLLKYPMYPGELIWCIVCWFCIGLWVINSNRINWRSTTYPNMYEGFPFRLNHYVSRKILKRSFYHFIVPIKKMLNIIMGPSTYVKLNRHGTETSLVNLIQHGLMYWKNYDGVVR